MLPSGNDAAHCLAEYFGGLLKKEAHEIEEKEKKEAEEKLEGERKAALRRAELAEQKKDSENQGSG